MHSHIGIFAYAKTKEEAEEKIFERINIQTDGEYDRQIWDYFISYKERDSRYDLLKGATLTTECSDLIIQLQKSTNERYESSLNRLKIEINDSEMNKDEVFTWAYILTSQVSFHLFDTDGETIRDDKTLHNVLTKWNSNYDRGEENPYKDDKVFFMDFDVHY